MTARLIGVTGGIGSGKSVVCRICALRGLPVYDCDSRAKQLMHSDYRLRKFLIQELGEDIYCEDGTLNRVLMSKHVFSGKDKAVRLQTEIHNTVRNDLKAMADAWDSPVAIVESAIMHTAALDRVVDEIWLVQAPEELRISRVRSRSALSREEILRRISVQQKEFDLLPGDKTYIINNDGTHPLLQQVGSLLTQF